MLNQLRVTFNDQVRFGAWTVDFVIPELRLVLEPGGRTYHPPQRRAKEKARREFIEALGYKIVPIRSSPGKLADDLPGRVGIAIDNRRFELHRQAQLDEEAAREAAKSRQLVDRQKAQDQQAAAGKVGRGIPDDEFLLLLNRIRSCRGPGIVLRDLVPQARLSWLTPDQRVLLVQALLRDDDHVQPNKHGPGGEHQVPPENGSSSGTSTQDTSRNDGARPI